MAGALIAALMVVACTSGGRVDTVAAVVSHEDPVVAPVDSRVEAVRPTSSATPLGSIPVEEPTTVTSVESRPGPRHASMVFSGDVIVHNRVLETARTASGYDFAPMFAPVEPIISGADLAICHLEVTLGTADQSYSDFPQFRSPPSLATALAGAGYDGCSLASNHSADFGLSGIVNTITAMDAAGLGHTGTSVTPDDRGKPAWYEANGIIVAHLSYSYGSNGAIRSTLAWMLNVINPEQIIADATAARDAGAEIVVVSLHWGNEYVQQVTGAQRKVAEALAAHPGVIDLIVGSHAHVVQPVSKVGTMWVAWGMGNHMTNNWDDCCKSQVADGVMIRAEVSERGDGTVGVDGVEVIPTFNERRAFAVLPAAEAVTSGDTHGIPTSMLRASFTRTMKTVRSVDAALNIRPVTDMPAAG